jgi:acetoin utilization deacetylase AcuC-like enzyme
LKPKTRFYILLGVDILASDKLGKLGCTLTAVKKEMNWYLSSAQNIKSAVQVSMGGGYSPEIKTIIEAHANTYRAAKDIF